MAACCVPPTQEAPGSSAQGGSHQEHKGRCARARLCGQPHGLLCTLRRRCSQVHRRRRSVAAVDEGLGRVLSRNGCCRTSGPSRSRPRSRRTRSYSSARQMASSGRPTEATSGEDPCSRQWRRNTRRRGLTLICRGLDRVRWRLSTACSSRTTAGRLGAAPTKASATHGYGRLPHLPNSSLTGHCLRPPCPACTGRSTAGIRGKPPATDCPTSRVHSIDVSPGFGTDATLFAGTSGGLFRSTDGGGSWTRLPRRLERRLVVLRGQDVSGVPD